MAILKVIITPTDGRYTLCTKITSLIGIMDDSTESVMKNQKIPKEISRKSGNPPIPPLSKGGEGGFAKGGDVRLCLER